jgi:hypothetical protein
MKSMKKVGMFALMAVIAVSLATVRAHAEGERVAVNVPFDFAVGNNVLKAGSYKVGVLQSGILDFWNVEARQHYFTLMPAGSAVNGGNGEPRLIFTRYGSETFLSKVALSVDSNFAAPRGGREKELLHGMAAGERDSLVIQPSR